ncbi:MAG: sugar ABC transporter permease [Spirochaetes bacterium DG_61]|jgi:multiple sugar transport system permease protein|nr:MAG: sugar ABC transporter permease [Spirochaetes bacterium DG_61]
MPGVMTRGRSITKRIIIGIVVVIMIFYLIPIYWVISTSFKPFKAVTAVPPKVFFKPEITSYIKLFTKRSLVRSPEELEERLSSARWVEKKVLELGQTITGVSPFPARLFNSFIIAIVSTLASVSLGTLTAYGFSRFRVKGEGDWLFFILSTRMLPPVVVTIPLFIMYRFLGLSDTRFGLILLYTCFNLSFATWVMKGFIDEIPKEYEEAAMVDGYTRFEAFRKIVLPQAATGIAATMVFCFIFGWNEYVFALIMTTRKAQTAPPFIPSQLGVGIVDWGVIAAGASIFLIPVAVFTFLLRKHLLRGVTFGAIRK